MNIYVPNYVDTNDYSEAEKLGDLIFVTKGVNVFTPSKLHEKFAKYFETASPEDALLLSGSNVVCATAYAEWTKKFPEARNLITFDRRSGYTLFTISN